MSSSHGSLIWCELMTPDPVAPGLEYRMIVRNDGGNAGGVMTLDTADA